jgi:hypothetical protein
MRRVLMLIVLAACAGSPRPKGPGPAYRDAPIAMAVAAGSGSAVAVGAAAAVTVAAVGVVVVGAEQFPDPGAGTPTTTAPPNGPPDQCRQCACYKKGIGRSPKGNHRYIKGGNGVEDYTRKTCQADCANDGYTGFQCAGDKQVTWFN